MKVIVVGGTGFIGTRLVSVLLDKHHEVSILTRDRKKVEAQWGQSVKSVAWDPLHWGTLHEGLEGKQVLINLAGDGIANSRWSSSRKLRLRQSRIDITRMLVTTLSQMTSPPRIFINASGVAYYGMNPATPVDEFSAPGKGFLADLCVEWEAEAQKATAFRVRVVCLRMGMVLGKGGGALAKMLPPFKMFLGGPIQPGTQAVSWIHLDDLAHLIVQTIHDPHCQGPVNAVSPHPVTMHEFCQTLARVLNKPCWIPVPSWALKLALGEMSTMMTTGQWVKPTVAHKIGVDYNFPFLETALQSIVGGHS